MSFSLDWTIEHAAQEIASVACKGLGENKFKELRMRFNHMLQRASYDPEIQSRIVTHMLRQKALNERQDVMDTQIVGLCLMWLAQSRYRKWTLYQLFKFLQCN